MQNRPKIALTCGCPCGVGAEIAGKAAADERIKNACEIILCGANGVEDKKLSPSECGSISAAAIDEAVKFAMSGKAQAIVTAPINKSHWHAAGIPFAGHTEYLAHVAGCKEVAMMMHSPKLIVTLATTHVAVAKLPQSLTIEKIFSAAKLTCEFINNGGGKPVAICGFNPHAGDNGMFGDEENLIVRPAIEELKSKGFNVSGPHPADTVFWQASRGRYSAVVAMYHDQGLCAVKTLDFENTVNVTLGLPFIRTSPDHGTAEDIAGKGVADHNNLVEAILLAAKLANARNS